MNDDALSRQIAETYAAEHANGARHKAPPAPLLAADMSLAYSVQRDLVAFWSKGPRGPVGGYKIALTSKAMQQMVGLDHPCGGAIFTRDILHSPATVSQDRFQHLGLEFELCFRLAHALPARGSAYSAQDLRGAVDAAFPAFELIEDRHADYSRLDARDLVADNAWCAGIVLGEAEGDWRTLDLTDTAVELRFNSELEQANTSAALGDPFAALAWVANHQAGQGRPLQAGHVVMTGSTMKTRFPVPGDRATYTVQGLGSVHIEMEI